MLGFRSGACDRSRGDHADLFARKSFTRSAAPVVVEGVLRPFDRKESGCRNRAHVLGSRPCTAARMLADRLARPIDRPARHSLLRASRGRTSRRQAELPHLGVHPARARRTTRGPSAQASRRRSPKRGSRSCGLGTIDGSLRRLGLEISTSRRPIGGSRCESSNGFSSLA
jgi:hypothetical protein